MPSSRSPPPKILRLSFRTLAAFTLALPLAALGFCLCYALVFHREKSTATHCGVANVVPSISAAVGASRLTDAVWKSAIAVHSTPRLLIAVLYACHNRRRLKRRQLYLANVSFAVNVTEIASLLTLSFTDSKLDRSFHAAAFVTFIVSAAAGIIIQRPIADNVLRSKQSRAGEENIFAVKRRIATIFFGCLFGAIYLFRRHNAYCEPYVYSFFGLLEIGIVLSNMSFHFTAYLEFADRLLEI